ncbi:hypothetical protein B0T10DRAFT_562926 [Thelonectria olida]|uniref:Uncharacterized protein n=1 Tax=Thelonectria olida TaxID=1576542 RepID=A0A9P8W253_9HYPO|nr:hypothetical protein B0T10DRAFT_562926 [Thelonectria olida]
MFGASTFVDTQYLLEDYSDRREAQASLFRRTRTLGELDYESDRLTQVQVLLLMTYWNGAGGNHRDSWY